MSPAAPTSDRRPTDLWARVGDFSLAFAFLSLIIVEIWVIGEHTLDPGRKVVATMVTPFVALPLAARSLNPFWAFLINSAATVGMVTIGFIGDYYQWGNLLLLFLVAVAYRNRESWVALIVGLGGIAYYFASFPSEGLDTGIMVFGLWLMVWLIGRVYSGRMAEHQLRTDRDLAAELAATRQARLDLESQRTRMARELHDLIGHTVNVMVVHAGAGRRAVHSDPDGAEQAFMTIETTGRSALDELDRVLGVLRSDDPDAPLAPLPGLSAVPELVDEFVSAGLTVELSIDGPVEAVPAGVGLTIYRVVQETLTNVMKHADAERTTVLIDVTDEAAIVTVEDNGRGDRREKATEQEAASSASGFTTVLASVGADRRAGGLTSGGRSSPGNEPADAGRGLVGITERVQLQGGTVQFGSARETQRGSGSQPGGEAERPGFRVQCSLPLVRPEAGDE